MVLRASARRPAYPAWQPHSGRRQGPDAKRGPASLPAPMSPDYGRGTPSGSQDLVSAARSTHAPKSRVLRGWSPGQNLASRRALPLGHRRPAPRLVPKDAALRVGHRGRSNPCKQGVHPALGGPPYPRRGRELGFDALGSLRSAPACTTTSLRALRSFPSASAFASTSGPALRASPAQTACAIEPGSASGRPDPFHRGFPKAPALSRLGVSSWSCFRFRRRHRLLTVVMVSLNPSRTNPQSPCAACSLCG